MMIRPREMVYPAIDLLIGVSGTFSAEFENCPFGAMFAVKEADELIERVPVGFPGPDMRWA
jgi:hypothetical protein